MKIKIFAAGLVSVLALGAMSSSVFAENITPSGSENESTGSSEVEHIIGESYLISIPSEINLNSGLEPNFTGTANVSASNVRLGAGSSLTVSVKSNNGALEIVSDTITSSIPYTISINNQTAVNASEMVSSYSEVFTMEAGETEHAAVPISITTTSFNNVKFAGEHKDTLTFKVNVASAAPTFASAEIAGKTWMTENLKLVPEGATWEDDGIYVDDATGEVYYSWEAAKKACPEGWELPTKADFESLTDGHDGSWIEGTPFNGVRAGRVDGGESSYVDVYGFYWSATESNSSAHFLFFSDGELGAGSDNKASGLSVRCVTE